MDIYNRTGNTARRPWEVLGWVLCFQLAPLLPFIALIRSPALLQARHLISDTALSLFLGSWIVTTAWNLYRVRHLWRSHRAALHPAAFSFLCLLLLIPFGFAAAWMIGGPYLHSASFFLSTLTVMIGPVAMAFLLSSEHVLSVSTGDVVLMAVSVTIAMVVGEVTMRVVFPERVPTLSTESDPTRSYWYFTHYDDGNGNNIANAYGFLGPSTPGPEPVSRVLVVGDSIPAAISCPDCFPVIAEGLLNDRSPTPSPVRIYNAAIPSFSIEQIFRFYDEKLAQFDHDLVVLVFYVDDINRELRYRKNNHLYTPAWPEWMQDLFYSGSRTFRILMERLGFTESTFLLYRRKSYEESIAKAVDFVNTINDIASARGARLAVFNVPRFNWPGRLGHPDRYLHQAFWTRINASLPPHVVRADLLPVLSQLPIDDYRISPFDIHFNDRGHQLVARYFADFIAHALAESPQGPVTP